jgi:hypothetical protein
MISAPITTAAAVILNAARTPRTASELAVRHTTLSTRLTARPSCGSVRAGRRRAEQHVHDRQRTEPLLPVILIVVFALDGAASPVVTGTPRRDASSGAGGTGLESAAAEGPFARRRYGRNYGQRLFFTLRSVGRIPAQHRSDAIYHKLGSRILPKPGDVHRNGGQSVQLLPGRVLGRYELVDTTVGDGLAQNHLLRWSSDYDHERLRASQKCGELGQCLCSCPHVDHDVPPIDRLLMKLRQSRLDGVPVELVPGELCIQVDDVELWLV